MCETCGCGDSRLVPVEIHESLMAANDRAARHNREHFASTGLFAINLMGSPGAGKTALLEATAAALPDRRLAAMSGDLATDRDARRLCAAGITATSITTGSACHLDADMVHHALHHLSDHRSGPAREQAPFDMLFIENVGNLVCPAIYDLGQAFNVVVLSVTEGEDKPVKYPTMFRVADLVVLTKIDLLPHLPGVSLEGFLDHLQRVNPEPRVMAVSALTGEGLESWSEWLERSSVGKARSDGGRYGLAHGWRPAASPLRGRTI